MDTMTRNNAQPNCEEWGGVGLYGDEHSDSSLFTRLVVTELHPTSRLTGPDDFCQLHLQGYNEPGLN